MDTSKKRHRPERLKGYDYTSPGYYFVTFNTRARGKNILCSLRSQGEPPGRVGPDPLGGASFPPLIELTPAGEIVRQLIENIDCVYQNTHVDCYVIMPDHVHLVICLGMKKDAPPRGSGPTEAEDTMDRSKPSNQVALPQIVGAIKSMTTRQLGYKIWQDDYYEHIIRGDADLQAIRMYVLTNPLADAFS